ncbi:MAG: SDR family NAD(P)-dependent oxidoreductase [Holophagales bacterium]|nr:SDR family NAD(P)-dependent oxidoreductase [Holophagales bacterium]
MDGGRVRSRPLLASGARRRGRPSFHGSRGLPRGAPDPGKEPLHDGSGGLRDARRRRHLPRLCHAPRRPPWLRRRGCLRPARRRGHRLHQGVQAREAGGDREGGRFRPRRRALRRRRPPHRGGPSRPGLCRGRLRGRPAHVGRNARAADPRRDARDDARPRERLRRHRRGRQHRLGHYDRPGRRVRRHLPPPRPSPRARPRDPDLARFTTDKDGLKHDIFERLKAKGERATPALVEKELARIERLAAALVAIRAVEAAGGTVHWYAGDLRDAARVGEIGAEILAKSPRVDVLLHGAGLEISRFLKDKEPREFDLVFDVKADGFFNLLNALGDAPIGATVAFSSVAGRFGNGGQTDYSSANDLLCKLSSSFRTTRPGTRGIALDWTAWGDIGMATRGSIPKMMELAGIDFLPAASGIPIIRRELVSSSFAGEIVEGLRLGILAKEWDETGGLDPAVAPIVAAGPMSGRRSAFLLHGGLAVETELDPKVQPFLFDHRIDGTAVLPGVMGIEAFAEAAAALVPGFRVASVEDVEFLAPFKLYRDEPRSVRIEAILRPAGDGVEAECRLVGRRALPGQAEPQETVHFRARVRLERGDARLEAVAAVLENPGAPLAAADIYSVYFHGPAYQVLESAWKNGSGVVGLLADPLPPNHVPESLPTLVAPRLIELSFQTAGVFELGTRGLMGLPLHVERVRPVRPQETASGRLHAVVTPSPSGNGSYDARVVDADGNVYLVVDGYRTVELPGAASAAQLEPFRAAMA